LLVRERRADGPAPRASLRLGAHFLPSGALIMDKHAAAPQQDGLIEPATAVCQLTESVHVGSECSAGGCANGQPGPTSFVRWERRQVQMGNSSVVLWKWVNASKGAGMGVPDDRRLRCPMQSAREQLSTEQYQTQVAIRVDHETTATVPRQQVFLCRSATFLCARAEALYFSCPCTATKPCSPPHLRFILSQSLTLENFRLCRESGPRAPLPKEWFLTQSLGPITSIRNARTAMKLGAAGRRLR